MRILERMHNVREFGCSIRVWAKSNDLRDASELETQRRQLGEALVGLGSPNGIVHIADIAEGIAKLDFCNAVEVLNSLGDGVLIYPEWP